MQTQIETLKGKIKADYINWTTAGGTKELSGYFKETVDNFDDSITVKTGKKYIKIIRDMVYGVSLLTQTMTNCLKKVISLKPQVTMHQLGMPQGVTFLKNIV